ncbi:MAG: macro domain-containing protein [Peptostreptococcaceae bacterium]
MKWIDYAKEIELFEEFNKDIKQMSNSEKYRAVRILINYFCKEGNWSTKGLPDSYEARRSMLHGILDMYPPKEIDSTNLELLERLLLTESYEKQITNVEEIEEIEKNIGIYKGDITSIKADVIVNTTNSKLLGGMPIHSSAGPRMRKDCNYIIEKQNHLEYIGSAKITRGYCLPSKYVLHTVGPIVTEGSPTKEQEKQLSSCYRSCLNTIKGINDVNSIVFSCISTGTSGYPKEEAAKVAINTVKQWINENIERQIKVVFNVFNEDDKEIYEKILITK